MKKVKFSFIALMLMFLYSCRTAIKNDNNTDKDNTQSSGNTVTPEAISEQSLNDTLSDAPVQPMSTEGNLQQANHSAAIVFHYICPNRCAGGGSEGQGKCPVCNADLVHNDAFHNQQQLPQQNMQKQTITTDPKINPPQPASDPPQNAKGIWHFICPKGCGGGAGQAMACSNCGTHLQHNQNYHE
jgi:hypothetical protein